MIYKKCLVLNILVIGIISHVTSFLDDDRSTFLGFTREISISLSTLELVEQLTTAVTTHARGDRRVRRYFSAYNTPFVGSGRRRIDWN